MSIGDFFARLPGNERLSLVDAYCDVDLAQLVCVGRLYGLEKFHTGKTLNKFMRSKVKDPADWDEYARHRLTYGQILEGYLERPLKDVQDAEHKYQFFIKHGVTLSGQMLWDFVLVDPTAWPKVLPLAFQVLFKCPWETDDYAQMIHLYENTNVECFKLALFCIVKAFRANCIRRNGHSYAFSPNAGHVYGTFNGNHLDPNYQTYQSLVNAFFGVKDGINSYEIHLTRSSRKRQRADTLVPNDICNRIWARTALRRSNNRESRWVHKAVRWMGTLIFHIKTSVPERVGTATIVLRNE